MEINWDFDWEEDGEISISINELSVGDEVYLHIEHHLGYPHENTIKKIHCRITSIKDYEIGYTYLNPISPLVSSGMIPVDGIINITKER